MWRFTRVSGLIIFILISSCEREKEFDFPVVLTGEVTDIDENGATFNMKIVSAGKEEIREFGFVWTTQSIPAINNCEKIIIRDKPCPGIFSRRITATIRKDVVYNVRAYAKTAKYITYGMSKSFQSSGSKGPEVLSVFPDTANPGDTVIVTGHSFSYIIANNVVYFDRFTAKIIKASQDTLTVIVPGSLDISPSEVRVAVTGQKSSEGVVFYLRVPVIADLSPKTATFDSKITVTGVNFTLNPGALHVYIGGIEVSFEVINDNSLSFNIPPELNTRLAEIIFKFNNITITSPVKFQLESIELLNFTPIVALTGDTIILTGKNFNPVPGKNIVRFGGIPASVIQSSGTEIISVLPKNTNVIYPSRNVEVSIEVCGEIKTYDKKLLINDKWFRKANYPWEYSLRYPGLALAYLGKAYANFQGYYNLYEFDPEKNTWTLIKEFQPTSYGYDLAFIIDNKIFYGLKRIEDESGIWVYDITGKTNTRLKNFPGGHRNRPISFSWGNAGYMMGGKISGQYLNEVWKYNSSEDSWELVSTLPDNHEVSFIFEYNGAHHACSYFDGNIHVYRFDIVNNQWINVFSYPETLSGQLFGFAIDNFLYYTATDQPCPYYLKRLNLLSGDVSTVSQPFIQNYYNSPATITIGGKAYVCLGGNPAVWEFDPGR